VTDQSFSVQLSSLLGFAQELQTQLQGIAAPMNALATQSGAPPQFGAFAEASDLAQSQQAALDEMHGLLGQVKQAIDFAQNVTSTVAAGYQQADHDVAAGLRQAAPHQGSPGYPGHQGSSGYPGHH
jgi:hypothetical protein